MTDDSAVRSLFARAQAAYDAMEDRDGWDEGDRPDEEADDSGVIGLLRAIQGTDEEVPF